MKNSLFKVIIISMFFFISFGTAQAQFSIGTSLSYSERTIPLDLNIRANYQINENWRAVLGYARSLGNKDANLKHNSVFFNANYFLLKKERWQLYGIAGLNFTHSVFNYETPVNGTLRPTSLSESSIRLELGIGGLFQISDSIEGVIEAKFQGKGQFKVDTGLNFSF